MLSSIFPQSIAVPLCLSIKTYNMHVLLNLVKCLVNNNFCEFLFMHTKRTGMPAFCYI